MKVLICLALLLALSSAAFAPSWKVLNTYSNQWKPAGVYAQSNAPVGYNNVITVCGNANYDNVAVSSYTYQIGKGSQILYQGTVGIPPVILFQGSGYCFYFNYQVPSAAYPNYYVYLTLQNPTAALATVEVDFYL